MTASERIREAREKQTPHLTCSFCGFTAATYTALVEHHKTSSGHKP